VGARNVGAAIAMYPQLEHRAMRLLLGMALTALDTPTALRPAQRYFGGRDALADILGYRLAAAPDESDAARRARKSAYEQVRRALAELIAEGAVTRTVTAENRFRSEYVLHVTVGPVDNDPAQAHLDGGSEAHPHGGS